MYWATGCCEAKRHYIPLRLPVVRIILYNRPLRIVDRGGPFPYGDDFEVKDEEIGPKNAYFWNTNLE